LVVAGSRRSADGRQPDPATMARLFDTYLRLVVGRYIGAAIGISV
jgi:hypothetical protein